MTSSDTRLLTPAFVRATLVHLLLGIGGAFGLHFAGFLEQLGAGEAAIGRIFALQALVALILSPFVGPFVDAYGRPLAIRLGGALLVAADLAYLGVTALGPVVWLLRVLEGVGGTLMYAALFTYAADIVPAARRTQGLAWFGAAGLVPMSISTLAGDFLLGFATYDALFLSAAASLALGVLVAWPLPDARSALPQRAAPAGLLATATQRDLLPVWLAAFSFFFSMAAVLTFTKTFVLASKHGSVGAFFTAYALVALLLRVLGGQLPDRIGAQRMVLPSLAIYAAGVLVLGHADGPWLVIAGGALCGAGHGYAFPVFLSLTVSRAQPEARGSATALFTTVDWAGTTAAPPVLGLVIERLGYGAGFSSLALTLATGALAFLLLDARHARPHTSTAGAPPADPRS